MLGPSRVPSLVGLAAVLSADYWWSHVRSWVLGEALRNLERSETWGLNDFLMWHHQEGSAQLTPEEGRGSSRGTLPEE